MRVTIIYASNKAQYIEELDVVENATVKSAIEQSNLLQQHSEVSLKNNQVGIFNQIVSFDTKIKESDRIEVYRPLTMDPMQARRLREKRTK